MPVKKTLKKQSLELWACLEKGGDYSRAVILDVHQPRKRTVPGIRWTESCEAIYVCRKWILKAGLKLNPGQCKKVRVTIEEV